MPENAPEEKISVTSIYGKTEGAFKYRDTRGMLFDFDTPCKTGVVLGNHGWHSRDIVTDETSLKGNYMILGGAAMGDDGGWNDGNFSFEYWAGNWADPENYAEYPRVSDLADFTDFANLNLKFEINIPKDNAWSAAPIQIYFGAVTQISNGNDKEKVKDIYGNVLAGCNNTFFRQQGILPRALYMPWKFTTSTVTSSVAVSSVQPISAVSTCSSSKVPITTRACCPQVSLVTQLSRSTTSV